MLATINSLIGCGGAMIGLLYPFVAHQPITSDIFVFSFFL